MSVRARFARIVRFAGLILGGVMLTAVVVGCGRSAPPRGGIQPAVPLPMPMPVPTPPQQGPNPSQPFLMSGQIKDIGSQGVLVEGPAGGDACWVSLPTSIQIVTEEPDGTTQSAQTADLAIGQDISVWHSGPIFESYPCQTTGAFIKIHVGAGQEAPDAEEDGS